MKAGEKPQFDSAWWTKNKAKALVIAKETALDKALAAFEKAFDAFRASGIDANLDGLSKALNVLPAVIQATIKKCDAKANKETIECLKKFDPLIKNLQRDIKSESSRRDKIDLMTVTDCAYGGFKKEFAALAAANHDDDSLVYFSDPALKGGKAGTAKEFAKYLVQGKPDEINVAYADRLQFSALADKDKKTIDAMPPALFKKWLAVPRRDIAKGPWKKIYEEAEKLLRTNLLPNFKKELRKPQYMLASLR